METPNAEPAPVSPQVRALTIAEFSRLDWTKELSGATLREFCEQAEIAIYNPGETLIELNSLHAHVYFVVAGRLKSALFDLMEKPVQEGEFSRGSVVGLFSLVSAEQSPQKVWAAEQTSVFRFTLEQLLRFSSDHPDFQLAILRLGANLVKQVVMVDRRLPSYHVIGIVHHGNATRSLTTKLSTRLRELGEAPCIAGDDPQWAPSSIPFRFAVRDGKPVDASERESILKEWSHARRLIIDIRLSHFVEDVIRLLASYAQTILWCIAPDQSEFAADFLGKCHQSFPWLREKIQLVWLLEGDKPIPPLSPKLLSFVHRDFKLTFDAPRTNQGMVLSQGLERIVHYLRGVQIGVALGGGAARGMAHFGVLKALEEQGIVIDRIAGTSAGAMTGTIYSVGMSPDYGTRCFKQDLQPSWFFRRLPGGGYWYLLYKYRRNLFDSMLRKYLHDYHAEQLTIPVTTIAVDLVEGEPLVRTAGDATKNILESINLPPLALPIFDQGVAIVDGGLLNNVPANVLVSQGCNFVIASTVTAKLEKDFMGVRSKGRPKLSRFSSSLQVIMRQNMIQSYNMNSVGVQPADFVIDPDVTSFDISEFTRADEMSIVGYDATVSVINDLRSRLNRLDPQLFPA